MKDVDDAPHYDRAGNVAPFYVYHARAILRAAAVGHGKVLLKHANAYAQRANERAKRLHTHTSVFHERIFAGFGQCDR